MTPHDPLQLTLRLFYAQWSVSWAKTQRDPHAMARAASTDTQRFVEDESADILVVLELMAKPAAQQRGLATRLKTLSKKVPTTSVAGEGLTTRACSAFQSAVVNALADVIQASLATTGELPTPPQPQRGATRGSTTRESTTPAGATRGGATRGGATRGGATRGGATRGVGTRGTTSGTGSVGQRAKPPQGTSRATRHDAPSESSKGGGLLDGILGGLAGAVAGGVAAAGSLNDLLGAFRGGGGGKTRSAPPVASGPVTRGSAGSAGAEPPELVSESAKAILSADAPKEILVGADAGVNVRIELDAPSSAPLGTSATATINRVEQIAVIVTVHGSAVALVDPFLKLLNAPSADTPSTAQFAIRGLTTGSTDITVQFMQGSAPLGLLRLSLAVVAKASDPDSRVSAVADSVEPAANARDVLSLFIDEQKNGDQLTYRYLLTWDAKDLRYADYSSAPFLDRGSGVGATPLAYIQSVYRRIVDRALVNYDDLAVFKSEVEGIGLEMCTQLFDNELARLLWQNRDDLEHVWITSAEAYVPWELMMLRNPDGRGAKSVDDRHLAERKLLRSLSGRQPPSTLALKDWRYVMSEFPEGSFASTQSELPLFTDTLPQRGVQVSAIVPRAADVLQAMRDANFDVLHFSGHGLASPDKIDEATLILGDRKKPNGEIESVGLQPDTLSQTYDLSERHPLVFLNACETGRQAPSLTNMGGWPKKFLDLGASVFVGTSWSVREKPAAVFSRTFYESLLDHHTLADAAAAARAAAKKLGDASWLAYTVYGAPSARDE